MLSHHIYDSSGGRFAICTALLVVAVMSLGLQNQPNFSDVKM